MSGIERIGWDNLRHGGLLLDSPRLRRIAEYEPDPLTSWQERELRRQAGLFLADAADMPAFVRFVLEEICGFTAANGHWQRGPQLGAEWGRRAVTGETAKPRYIWRSENGAILPVFLEEEPRLGIGRGRRTLSQVVQWLRGGQERLAVLTNGRQWRLVFAGIDFDAWCEWDVDLWFEEGSLSSQVASLRTLLAPSLWTPPVKDGISPLLEAILESRKGQADLSAALGERVREAVEILIQGHDIILKDRCGAVDRADIYRAAVRMVMRMVVVLFAESRDLLPRDNAFYHQAYGLTGLLETLEKIEARGGNRLARSWSAWPRVLALLRLVHQGSHHEKLPIPAYGGELFAPGDAALSDGVAKALAVFESACFDNEILPDRDVYRMLEHLIRTRVKIRQGRSTSWITVPVDFSDLSSEYIGILYEGLLDFDLRTAPPGDPVIFLAIGKQPALPLSRLEGMDDRALSELLEKIKDTGRKKYTEEGEAAEDSPDEDDEDQEAEDDDGDESDEEEDDVAGPYGASEESLPGERIEDSGDERHTTRTRAENWARRAVETGNLVPRPRGTLTPERRLVYEESVSRKARQLVRRVILPGEWYLVRWGGTRKGSGTFYTRPGLAVPTVHRTLRPLAYNSPADWDGRPEEAGPPTGWTPKKPEEILALRVCDPACGSGTFPVAALRFLAEALYASLLHHKRIRIDGEKAMARLLAPTPDSAGTPPERLKDELLPCRPEDEDFEKKTRAILRRHVVERCLYGVDLDPLAVELCRLSLWIETMDRSLPFSFLDHKIKCGNSLIGAWIDQFPHYPVMAWKNREGGDKNHTNGVHFEKEGRTKAIKSFVRENLTPDLRHFLTMPTLFPEDLQKRVATAHAKSMAVLARLHDLPVYESAERGRIYRDEFMGSPAWNSLKEMMDLWCACWFWPAEDLGHAPLPSTFADPPPETKGTAARIAAAKRFFHWEIEFPDVFRSPGTGFDAILGNPPWDIAKPNSKEFFSNIDPLYRAYGKQEAIRHQTTFFAEAGIEQSWLDYNADFRAQSNFMAHGASPFGDPRENEASQDRFAISRGNENERIHALWRKARAKSRGFADPAHPFRHQGSADINLYKAFLEQAHALLREGGRLGFIVPSGLYSDHGTGGLRRLFLDRCRWEWLFSFENRQSIFDIHRSYKFNPVIIQKGGATERIMTAFMHRKLDDWERAESLVTPYTRDQVTRFSPRSLALLEIQSKRDLEILEKIYTNSVLLGDDSPDGWGIRYATEFHMTNDSRLFPPRPRWENDGYRPNVYGEWVGPNLEIAIPLYQGRMIGQFDFSHKGWVSGKGRSSVWRNIDWYQKVVEPEFLSNIDILLKSGSYIPDFKICYKRMSSATNQRSMIATLVRKYTSESNVIALNTSDKRKLILLVAILNSFIFDFLLRLRFSGLALDYHVTQQVPVPWPQGTVSQEEDVIKCVLRLNCAHELFAPEWISILNYYGSKIDTSTPWRILWAVTPHERLRLQCILDVLISQYYRVTEIELCHVLRDCDILKDYLQTNKIKARLRAKGFWRVDREADPELRHTILTLVAFNDLEEKIRAFGGDREKGIEAFLNQNDGQGWLLPETLRLADYGLGHDERAKHPQPVAGRLGPRFYDWQLTQNPEESWRECRLHARNLLGEAGYQQLLEDAKEARTDNKQKKGSDIRKTAGNRKPKQRSLFGWDRE